MSYPTQPAFVRYSDWDDVTRQHPAMKWMEDYTRFIDTRSWDTNLTDWHTKDFELHKADGEVVSGGQPAWEEVAKVYAVFTAQHHRPLFLVCWETEKGWEMIGQAHIYANLVGPSHGDEKKVKDPDGRDWDIKIPGGFHFEYYKTADGIRLNRTELMSDSLPAVQILMKRGVIKA